MKSAGTKYWNDNYINNATNSSGFSGLPAGQRRFGNGNFDKLRDAGYWWSSTGYNTNLAWSRYLTLSGTLGASYDNKTNGFSVRCLRD